MRISRKAFVALLGVLLILPLACAPGVEQAALPENFITYTYPDEFSLSFPSDWELDYSFEIPPEALSQRIVDSPFQPLLDMIQIVLYGGLPGGPDYEPVVTVSVVPRFSGFYTLDEIYETDKRMFTEEVPEYRENKVTRTTVDGREATIIDSQDNRPDLGRRRYLILTTPASSYVWYVVCSVSADDYGKWQDIFRQVVSSLKIFQ